MLHQKSTIMNLQKLEVKAILSSDSVTLGNKYVQLKIYNLIHQISFNVASSGFFF
jgi:hypothetical protein